jgi:hypothetical protein
LVPISLGTPETHDKEPQRHEDTKRAGTQRCETKKAAFPISRKAGF